MSALMRWLLVAASVGFLVALTPSLASAAVTVTTEPPYSFDKDSAGVCGYWTSDQTGFTEFEYGPDTTYGSVVGFAATDNGITSGSDCITLMGLTPSTTYHYRFVFLLPEMGSFGCPLNCTEYDGSDQTVTTQAGSTPEITGPTSATSYGTGFNVTTAIDAGGYPTTWRVDYGTSPSNLSSSTTPQDVVFWPNTPISVYADVPSSGMLPTNQVYYWQIVATNTLGTTTSSVGSVTLGSLMNTLSVSVLAGTGSGAVTSSPAGIDCATTCSHSFPTGSQVTLTPLPAWGSTFAGWSGGGCSGNGTCVVTLNSDSMVTAIFNTTTAPPSPPTSTLTVSTAGKGSGTITSSPVGIDCPTVCSDTYAKSTVVTLTAHPAGGSSFAGWSGICFGTGPCAMALDAGATVTATFTKNPPPPPKIQCVVPKLRGKKLAAAKTAIKKHHCSVGKIIKVESSPTSKGHVISQKPRPGKHLRSGAKVVLKVGK